MTLTNNYVIDQLLVPSLALFFLVWSAAGVAAGVGLIVSSARMLRFLDSLNHWVSSRRSLKPLEVPRDTGLTVRRNRRWFGAVLVVAAAYPIYTLAARFDISGVALALGTDIPRLSLAAVAVDAMRWFRVVGSVGAAAAGVMLMFFPRALDAVEARANRWVSSRQMAGDADTMHLTLDRWVAAFPRAAGWIIAVFSLAVAAGSGIVLLARP